MKFVHNTLPQRVRFASGKAAQQLAAEVQELEGPRADPIWFCLPDVTAVVGRW